MKKFALLFFLTAVCILPMDIPLPTCGTSTNPCPPPHCTDLGCPEGTGPAPGCALTPPYVCLRNR